MCFGRYNLPYFDFTIYRPVLLGYAKWYEDAWMYFTKEKLFLFLVAVSRVFFTLWKFQLFLFCKHLRTCNSIAVAQLLFCQHILKKGMLLSLNFIFLILFWSMCRVIWLCVTNLVIIQTIIEYQGFQGGANGKKVTVVKWKVTFF